MEDWLDLESKWEAEFDSSRSPPPRTARWILVLTCVSCMPDGDPVWRTNLCGPDGNQVKDVVGYQLFADSVQRCETMLFRSPSRHDGPTSDGVIWMGCPVGPLEMETNGVGNRTQPWKEIDLRRTRRGCFGRILSMEADWPMMLVDGDRANGEPSPSLTWPSHVDH